MRSSNQYRINYFSQQPQRKSSMWKAGWAIVCLFFPCPSFLFWHNGTQTLWEKNSRAWGPVDPPLCPKEHQHQCSFLGCKQWQQCEWQCSLQGTLLKDQGTLAEAQVSWVSKWRRWTEHAQAETWTWMAVNDWPDMPGNDLDPFPAMNEQNWVFFSTWSRSHKSLRSSWSREGLWWLLSPQVLRLAYKANPSKSNPFHIRSYKD